MKNVDSNQHEQSFLGASKKENKNYYAISQHYKWAIQQVFNHPNEYDRIIILEGLKKFPKLTFQKRILKLLLIFLNISFILLLY